MVFQGKTTARMALVVALAGATSCARNPATGKRNFTLVSENQEQAMGKEAAAEVAQSLGLYRDADAEAMVQRIGKQLAAASERPDLPWSFQIVDDPAVNAFALPGGYIFVTRGLLTHLSSEAQLASVLGHEIAHVTARHSARQISKAQVAQIGLVVGSAVSETFRQFGQLGAATLSLMFLKYGRDAEREADELGVRYATRGGYEVRAMPEVLQTLDRVSEAAGGDRLPSWMATHPAPDERIERVNKLIASANPPPGKQEREAYLRTIDGMVFGENPRNGFFAGNVFKHPDMRFQLTLPQGWKGQNLSQAVIAQSPRGDAGMQLTIAPAMSPNEALQKFGTQQGVVAFQPAPTASSGLPAATGRFAARTEQGDVAGLVTFVSYGGKTFQLLGLTSAANAATFEESFRQAHASFAALTDAQALAVQPARIEVVSVPRSMTLAELQQSQRSSVPVERLAIVNQVEPGAALQAGQQVKTVQGGPPGTGDAN